MKRRDFVWTTAAGTAGLMLGRCSTRSAAPAFASVRTDHRRRLHEWVERTGDEIGRVYIHMDA